MKLVIAFAVGLLCLTAAEKAAKPKARASQAAKTRVAAPLTPPAGATRVDDHTYTWTDPKGAKWIYRETPFGWSRAAETGQEASAPAGDTPFGTVRGPIKPREANSADREKDLASMTAVDAGDSVRFTRRGPFGDYRWTKKKADLDETEKAVWNRDLAKKQQADAQESRPDAR
jgi:hypothetical protein